MIQYEKKIKEELLQKYSKELAIKTGKKEHEIIAQGLEFTDFKNCVLIIHEDNSICNYRYAFFIEANDCYAVFTEHCGYHEFHKTWLDSIEEYELGKKKIIFK